MVGFARIECNGIVTHKIPYRGSGPAGLGHAVREGGQLLDSGQGALFEAKGLHLGGESRAGTGPPASNGGAGVIVGDDSGHGERGRDGKELDHVL